MFKMHHQGRRHTNIFIVIFRLILSVVMFTILIAGIYSAYKHFSGLDPLKLDPLAVAKNILAARTPKQFIGALPALKIDPKILGQTSPASSTVPANAPLFRFLLLADSHSDNEHLAKAIVQAKNAYPDLKFIIGLGDYSDVGTAVEFKEAKSVFDLSNLRYFLIPGDHDLWDCRNRNLKPSSCFEGVFGPAYQSFEYENFKFLLLDNSDDYEGVSDDQKIWLQNEFEKIKNTPNKGILVFLHEPLFHPSSEHIMGKIQNSLKEQARNLEFSFKNGGVKKVFAGDIHFFSQYNEPVTGLPMVTIGAVTTERNPQTPRFAVVEVYGNGDIKVEDVEIK